ncbi:hypothetical protein V6N11_018904 [Hibiscus sabdariffa]|uniref:Uncharacterized protein n=1 Tax=Hibiscus sabdariffa TaxID=183260 RepID=A0ABR2R0V5_9ROSI
MILVLFRFRCCSILDDSDCSFTIVVFLEYVFAMPSGEVVISESLSIDDDSSSTSGFFNKQINVRLDDSNFLLWHQQPLHIVPNDNTIGAASSASSFADVVEMESDLQHNADMESMSHGSTPTLPVQEAVLQGLSMSSVAPEGVTLTEESNSQSEVHMEESAHTTVEIEEARKMLKIAD